MRRRDESVFVIRPEKATTSPFDVEETDVDISTEEILEFIAEGRRYT